MIKVNKQLIKIKNLNKNVKNMKRAMAKRIHNDKKFKYYLLLDDKTLKFNNFNMLKFFINTTLKHKNKYIILKNETD